MYLLLIAILFHKYSVISDKQQYTHTKSNSNSFISTTGVWKCQKWYCPLNIVMKIKMETSIYMLPDCVLLKLQIILADSLPTMAVHVYLCLLIHLWNDWLCRRWRRKTEGKKCKHKAEIKFFQARGGIDICIYAFFWNKHAH